MKKRLTTGVLMGLLLLMLCPLGVSAAARQDTDNIPTYSNGRWRRIDGVKYCYDNNKKKITGWATIGKHTYYFDSSGAMQTGLKKISKKYYYFEPSQLSGKMIVGFKTVDGQKYYFDKESGAAKTGGFTIGRKKYYARKSNAVMYVNVWRRVSGKYHYYDSRGVQRDGWFTLGSSKYYCHPTRGKLSGWKTVQKKVYYFNSRGAVEINQWIARGSTQKWFVDETGAVIKKSSTTSSTSEDYGQIIMVGDSRFWRANRHYGITAPNVKYISRSGQGYRWLKEEGMPQIQTAVTTFNQSVDSSEGNTRVALVFNLGVNDLKNYSKYISYMNRQVSNYAAANNCDLYYVSVNPVDESKYRRSSGNVKSKTMKKINTFNKKLKNGLNSDFTYIDTCKYLKSKYTYSEITLKDGVHYTSSASQAIFNYIMLYVHPS